MKRPAPGSHVTLTRMYYQIDRQAEMNLSHSLSSGPIKNPGKEKTMQRDVYVAKQATRFWFSLLVFGALVLLLAACGSSSGSGTSGTTPTATSAQNTTPTS